METAEKKARDMLERMGVELAQEFSAGDLVELANLISSNDAATDILSRLIPLLELDNEHAVTGIFSTETWKAIEQARQLVARVK